ncbi:MAG: SoxR reducing system RseC family protein, partial [Gammaproteobacteria bacterium]|nr:SoxR reducing system RseC family protein [Gammaproteobacteria bacterium]
MTSMNLIRESRVVARHVAPDDGIACAEHGTSAELVVQAPCGSCASPCLLGSTGERRLHVGVPDGWNLALGERVDLAVNRARLTRVCAFIFGAPLTALVAGALLGT